jgi:hypothetical protein
MSWKEDTSDDSVAKLWTKLRSASTSSEAWQLGSEVSSLARSLRPDVVISRGYILGIEPLVCWVVPGSSAISDLG